MIKVSMDYDPSIRGLRVWIIDERGSDSFVARPTELRFEKTDPTLQIEPTFVFDRFKGEEFLQGLAEALVQAGFKPNEIRAHDKQVEAIKYHLEDMRKLALRGKKCQ